eukprot:TRINITY_DN10243_c3_g1_i1.p1 TRINITY_DN10243_c3_g1~~TRINITY_DN10243_c3_g1_i1.p1  ORF type:complete len:724 (-),score=108.04 TRINITY_DN10243_c3_g1_i1:316-2487(-)
MQSMVWSPAVVRSAAQPRWQERPTAVRSEQRPSLSVVSPVLSSRAAPSSSPLLRAKTEPVVIGCDGGTLVARPSVLASPGMAPLDVRSPSLAPAASPYAQSIPEPSLSTVARLSPSASGPVVPTDVQSPKPIVLSSPFLEASSRPSLVLQPGETCLPVAGTQPCHVGVVSARPSTDAAAAMQGHGPSGSLLQALRLAAASPKHTVSDNATRVLPSHVLAPASPVNAPASPPLGLVSAGPAPSVKGSKVPPPATSRCGGHTVARRRWASISDDDASPMLWPQASPLRRASAIPGDNLAMSPLLSAMSAPTTIPGLMAPRQWGSISEEEAPVTTVTKKVPLSQNRVVKKSSTVRAVQEGESSNSQRSTKTTAPSLSDLLQAQAQTQALVSAAAASESSFLMSGQGPPMHSIHPASYAIGAWGGWAAPQPTGMEGYAVAQAVGVDHRQTGWTSAGTMAAINPALAFPGGGCGGGCCGGYYSVTCTDALKAGGEAGRPQQQQHEHQHQQQRRQIGGGAPAGSRRCQASGHRGQRRAQPSQPQLFGTAGGSAPALACAVGDSSEVMTSEQDRRTRLDLRDAVDATQPQVTSSDAAVAASCAEAIVEGNEALQQWTLIWISDSAFKPAASTAKGQLEALGCQVKCYKTHRNATRALDKKYALVRTVVLVTAQEASPFLAYLVSRPELGKVPVIVEGTPRGSNIQDVYTCSVVDDFETALKAVHKASASC